MQNLFPLGENEEWFESVFVVKFKSLSQKELKNPQETKPMQADGVAYSLRVFLNGASSVSGEYISVFLMRYYWPELLLE